MAVNVFKTFSAGEILTAADLNSSFTQITSNGEDLGWPATKAKDLDGQSLILDEDGDTWISGSIDDRIAFRAGGVDAAFLFGTDLGEFYLGGVTGHGRLEGGICVNQNAGGGGALIFQSEGNIAHGLTTGGVIPTDTEDFMQIRRATVDGGTRLVSFAEDTAQSLVTEFVSHGGTAQTTDTTSSFGLMALTIAEHDGANALIDAPANQNILSIHAWNSGNRITRLLLKGDDGELHLGNSTPVALDAEDDVHAVRALQRETSHGIGIIDTPFDRPLYNYDNLHKLGVVGERDARGEFLIRVQPYLALHDGAIWQLYTHDCEQDKVISELTKRLAVAEQRLAALPA